MPDGAEIERAAEDLARIGRDLVHRAGLLRLVEDERVALVEIEHAEPLDGAVRHLRAAIFRDLVDRVQQRLVEQLLARETVARARPSPGN